MWKFRADPERIGERDGWFKGLQQTRLIPVPCSWNEIFDDLRNYTGGALVSNASSMSTPLGTGSAFTCASARSPIAARCG